MINHNSTNTHSKNNAIKDRSDGGYAMSDRSGGGYAISDRSGGGYARL